MHLRVPFGCLSEEDLHNEERAAPVVSLFRTCGASGRPDARACGPGCCMLKVVALRRKGCDVG